MRKCINLIILAFVVFIPLQSLASKTYLASNIFKKMEKKVFRVKTALGKDSPKASYGSGFVVSKDGLIITNYHVVATSLQRHEKYKIYVEIDDKSYKASIMAMDIINDLALLKIDKKFKQQVFIRESEMRMGDRLFSMGIPQDLSMSITEGIYNGIKKNGLYENVHMSSPLNAGMSGGPVLDSDGKLIGVNVSVLLFSQNISFAVTKNSVKQLLERYYSGKKKIDLADDNDEAVDKEILRQLLVAQKSLMTDFIKSSKELKDDGKWKYIKPTKELKCWQADYSDKKKNLYNRKTEICYVPNSSYIMHGVYSGSYELKFSIMSSNKLNKVKFYDYLNMIYNRHRKIESFFINYSKKKNFTKYQCNESVVVTESKIPMKVNYCLRGYVDYKGVFDLNLKAVTLMRKKDAFSMEANVRGFTKDNIDIFTKTVLNGIRYSQNANN